MSLHIVERLVGSHTAEAAAGRMEYPWTSHQSPSRLLDDLLHCEHQVWQAVIEKNGKRLAELFADDYVEITFDGLRVFKADVVSESPAVDEVESYSIDLEEARELSTDAALLSYHLNLNGTSRGVPIVPCDRWVLSLIHI